MLTSVLIAVVCTALAYGLWRLLRAQVRHQQAHTEVSPVAGSSVAPVVPAAQPVVEQSAPAAPVAKPVVEEASVEVPVAAEPVVSL